MSAAPRLSDIRIGRNGAETRVVRVEQSMRDPLTEQDRAIWLHLRDEGGWWRWSEVCQALQVQPARGPSSLARLFNRCHLSRRRVGADSDASKWLYGVTAVCQPLPGHTLQPGADLQAAA